MHGIEYIINWKIHASLQCIRPHPIRKQIAVRALRRIKDDALAEDLDRFNVDQGCVDVDIMIEQYDKYLSDLLNKHAPKNIYVVVVCLPRPMEGMGRLQFSDLFS